jgi:hypothetical protein
LSKTADVAYGVIFSMLPDLHDTPMTAELAIDGGGYAKVVSDSAGGNSVTPVSAFNSSI